MPRQTRPRPPPVDRGVKPDTEAVLAEHLGNRLIVRDEGRLFTVRPDNDVGRLPVCTLPGDATQVQRKTALLEHLRNHGNIGAACAFAGVSRTAFKYWKDRDPDYKEMADDAIADSKDAVELEARRRAVDGEVELVLHAGSPTMIVDEDGNTRPLMVRKRSDALMALLLKAELPHKYREKGQLDVNVGGGVLIVPGMAPSAVEWEQQVSEQQSRYRETATDVEEDGLQSQNAEPDWMK